MHGLIEILTNLKPDQRKSLQEFFNHAAREVKAGAVSPAKAADMIPIFLFVNFKMIAIIHPRLMKELVGHIECGTWKEVFEKFETVYFQ